MTHNPAPRYLVNSLAGRAYVTALDAALGFIVRRPRSSKAPVNRLLIGIGGHIGDAIIASSALRWVRDALPGAEVGIAISSAASPVLEGHPLIKWVHHVDHWKLNRSTAGWLTKRRVSIGSHGRARAEIKAVEYDAGIDLYPYYPNMAVLMWRSEIPWRIGYWNGGGGPIFTDPVAWHGVDEHMAVHHRKLLRRLNRDVDVPLAYDLPELSGDTVAAARRLLWQRDTDRRAFVVMHPGAGDPRKEWAEKRWVDLIRAVQQQGLQVVLTGAGRRDSELIAHLRSNTVGVTDLCGFTNLPLLRAILQESAAVVSVDTATAHLAAAEKTPGVVIMSPTVNVAQWRPLSSRIAVLMQGASPADVAQALRQQCVEYT